jgi:TPR repeat protein
MKFATYKREAEAGDAIAQMNLGICYFNGSGVAVDKAEAVKWWKRAADSGDADALMMLQSMT